MRLRVATLIVRLAVVHNTNNKILTTMMAMGPVPGPFERERRFAEEHSTAAQAPERAEFADPLALLEQVYGPLRFSHQFGVLLLRLPGQTTTSAREEKNSREARERLARATLEMFGIGRIENKLLARCRHTLTLARPPRPPIRTHVGCRRARSSEDERPVEPTGLPYCDAVGETHLREAVALAAEVRPNAVWFVTQRQFGLYGAAVRIDGTCICDPQVFFTTEDRAKRHALILALDTLLEHE